ncbi:MAG: polysaccharide biosynthesis protein [Lachnospiraceae bacterium]
MGKQKKSNSSFLIQGMILAAAGMITRIIGIAYRIPVNNILGDVGQGFYGYAFQIYSIALILTSYSLPLAVSKLVSARVAKGEYKNARRILNGAIFFAVIVGVVVGVLIFFGGDFMATHLLRSPLSVYALKVLAPCLFIVALLGVLRGYFQGLGTMLPTAASQILEQIINAVFSIVGASYLLQAGKKVAETKGNKLIGPAYGAAGGTFGTLMGAVFALLFLVFVFYAYQRVMKRQMARDRTRYNESYSDIFRILLITIAPVILSTAIYNVSEFFDSIMFSQIMAAQGHTVKEYTGLWGMFNGKYNTLINIPLAMANALGASIIPSLTAAVTEGNRKQAHAKIHMAIRFAMIIAIPSCVGFLVLAKPILSMLYSGNIEIPAMMLRIGAVTVVFYCLSTVTNAVLQGVNKMTVPVKNAAISLVIHLLSLFLMLVVFKWGIYAVVVSNIVFSLSMCILNARALKNAESYIQETVKTFAIPIIAAAIMGITAAAVQLLLDLFVGGIFATLVTILVAVSVYGISLLKLGGLSEKEILAFPKGTVFLLLFQKLHLLKQED